MKSKNQTDNEKSTGQVKNKTTEKKQSTSSNKTGPSKKKVKKHFFKHKKKARKSEKPEKQGSNNTKQRKGKTISKQGNNKNPNKKKPPKKKPEKNKKPKEKVNHKLEVGKAVIETEWHIESISRYIIAVKAALEKTPERQDGKKDLLEVWINSSLPVDLIYQIIKQYPDELNVDKKKFTKDNKPLF